MEEEGHKRLSKAKISSSKSQSSGGRQQPTFPSTPSTRSNVYSDGFEEAMKLPGKSTSSSLGEKIRSSLPNIGHHLRRLMKFKSQREVKNERETSDVTMASINTSDSPKVAQTPEEEDENRTLHLLSENYEFPNSASGLIAENLEVPAIASSSSAESPLPYDSRTSEHSMESSLSMSSIFVQPAIPTSLMISSGIEASLDDLSEQMTLATMVTDEGAIIAGDPLDFAATLNAQLGYDRIRTYAELQARREQEPRSIPLLFFQDEARRESYMGSSTSGEHGSSSSGSENSIEHSVSEVGEDSTETSSVAGQRVGNGRDEAQQYYDAALRAAVRKRFRHLDDEPPIY